MNWWVLTKWTSVHQSIFPKLASLPGQKHLPFPQVESEEVGDSQEPITWEEVWDLGLITQDMFLPSQQIFLQDLANLVHYKTINVQNLYW